MSKGKIAKFCIFLPFFLILLLFDCTSILAQTEAGTEAIKGLEESGKAAFGTTPTVTAPQFLGMIAGAALAIAGSLFLFLIIYGGITIMTAAGNTDQVKKGKNIIIWAIIGAVILGAAYAITSLVFQAISGTPTPPPPSSGGAP
jgi:hypothetical protein